MSIVSRINKSNCLNFPKIIQLEITDRCPFHCPQCYKVDTQSKDANIDFLKSTILNAKSKGANLIVLNGGEPLLYKNIKELLLFIKKLDLHVNCFSSGYGLTDELIELMDYEYFHYVVSLNGSSDKVNSLSREGYDYAIAAIDKLCDFGIAYGVHWVARHDNVDDIVNLVLLLEEKCAQFLSIGSNKLSHARVVDSPINYIDLNELASFIKNYNGSLKLLVENCFPELSARIGLSLKNIFSGCGAGRTICHVSIEQKYSPCTHLHHCEDYPDITRYWDNSETLKKLRNRNLIGFSYCDGCGYIEKCKMCIASSNESYNNFNTGNSNCMIKVLKGEKQNA